MKKNLYTYFYKKVAPPCVCSPLEKGNEKMPWTRWALGRKLFQGKDGPASVILSAPALYLPGSN